MTLQDEVIRLNKRIEELTLENKRLQESVDYLTKKLYGSHSEKTSFLGIEGQMSLFDEAETEADKNVPEPTLEDIAGYKRKKFKRQREEILKDLPHEKKLCTLDEADRFCMKCGSPLKPVGEEFIRSEVQIIPAQIKVIDYYRETYELLWSSVFVTLMAKKYRFMQFELDMVFDTH